MKLGRPAILLFLVATLASTTDFAQTKKAELSRAEAQRVVRDGLKDPESARFGEFTVLRNRAACLGVNAKNSFGGYSGTQQALLMRVQGIWALVLIKEVAHEECVQVANELLRRKDASSESK